ncbi:MAG TPA: glycoside hydrolase family 3 N-terminal domain-containing protein [Blastocatellia bacterium]|nr:glycoside hydrolase family 3 N-terminal domain-containing protein [Blastocatellia bacterium]
MLKHSRLRLVLGALTVFAVVTFSRSTSTGARQAKLGARKAPTLTVDGLTFKDLNKNGVLDRYEDWRLTVEARVADLVSKMTIEEKAGLMVHASLMGFTGPGGVVLDAPARRGGGMPPGINLRQGNAQPMDNPSPADLILKRNVRYILVRPNAAEPPEITARFSNGVQEIAEGSRLGIPVAFSTDPRHSPPRFGRPASAAPASPNISQWPEQIGLAAIADPRAVLEFGRIAAKEYRAMGLSVSLSPMADIATEPRWNRINGTFGEDAEQAARLVKAYVEGFQGKQLGPDSVMTVTKHFPGDGPVKGGLDPHNDYGKWQIYPGKKFDHHLIPFQAAFEAGTGAIMPGYAIPVGVDTVGMGFSRIIVADLLRKKYRFDGLVVTDWLRNMPWGVEDLTEKQRQLRIVEAGCDQIGGDNDPRYIIELAKDGTIPTSRLDESARRVLRPLFQLGLFENPYVDADHAKTVVASSEFMQAGALAQRRSVVLLKNASELLPLSGKPKLYVENLSKETTSKYGTVVDSVSDADVTIVKVNAPYAIHQGGGGFFRGAHEGTLAYAGAENANELESIKRLATSRKPAIVIMYMERPAVLSEFIGDVAAVLAHFGSDDGALLDVVFGRYGPSGKLPFDLPRDMASVERQKEDVPRDLENPLFRLGYGLTYKPGKDGR